MTAAAAAGITLLSLNDIKSHSVFSGDQDSFADWDFALRAEGSPLGWTTYLTHVLAQTEAVMLADMNSAARELSNDLYFLFSQSTKGKALTLLRRVEEGNGLEAYRLITNEFRPTGDQSAFGMAGAVLQPGWWTKAPHSKRDFHDVLLDWDGLVNEYEVRTGEVISDNLKCATICGRCPKEVKDFPVASAPETRTNYQRMREAIRMFVLDRRGVSFAPTFDASSSSSSNGVAPMDVNAIGFDKQACDICGQLQVFWSYVTCCIDRSSPPGAWAQVYFYLRSFIPVRKTYQLGW